MKARFFSLTFFACAAACVAAVAVACSSFSGDAAVTEEAGSDAAAPIESGSDATSGIDAALPPTPGTVDCFGSTCNSAMGQTCCVDVDGGPTQCSANGASCALGVIPIKCDESTDCAPGRDLLCRFFRQRRLSAEMRR